MIDREDRGSVAILRLSHGKANALDRPFCDALAESLREIDASEASAAVLTARGSIFSAGVDLRLLLENGPPGIKPFLRAMEAVFRAMADLAKPLVGAINGHAIAGGCILAAGCDMRLMARGGGRIGAPELLVGVPFPPTAFELLRRMTTPAVLREVVYEGRTYDPDQALARNLVDRLVDPEDLEEEAIALATRLGAVPEATFAITKRQMRQSAAGGVERGEDLAREIETIWESSDAFAAVRDYVERVLGKRG